MGFFQAVGRLATIAFSPVGKRLPVEDVEYAESVRTRRQTLCLVS